MSVVSLVQFSFCLCRVSAGYVLSCRKNLLSQEPPLAAED